MLGGRAVYGRARAHRRQRSSRRCTASPQSCIAVFLPLERDVTVVVIAALVLGHAVVSRCASSSACGYVVPEQLVVVPLLLLVPARPYVPILIAAAGVLAVIPDFFRGSWSRDRWLNPIADSWALRRARARSSRRSRPVTPSCPISPIYLVALPPSSAPTSPPDAAIRNVLLDECLVRALASGSRAHRAWS